MAHHLSSGLTQSVGMISMLPDEARTMPTSSNSPALQLIDSVAIAIAQGYILARVRLTSQPSPVLRLAAAHDAIAWDVALLERELAVFRWRAPLKLVQVE